MELKDVGKSVKKNLSSQLSGKPVWLYWIVYCVLTAIFFGIFYVAMSLVSQQWWIPLVVIVLIGTGWGTLIYTDRNK
jgi:hypothetical protein